MSDACTLIPTSDPVWDPITTTSRADVYEVYARLREQTPVYYNRERDLWALSRFSDIMLATAENSRFLSGEGISLTAGGNQSAALPSIISMDNPRHDQLRRLVARAFTPRRMGAMEEWVRTTTRALVRDFASGDQVEFVEAVAAPLPILVICELLGVAGSDRDSFKQWSDALVRQHPDDPSSFVRARESARNIVEYFAPQIAERRRQPADDMISLLTLAEVEGERLSDEEVLGFCFVLIVAGHETTTNLIGNSVIALAEHPDIRTALHDDTTLIDPAIEELLRWCGPVHALARVTAVDVRLHDTTIPTGSRVALLWASGNRDEREFGEDAHQLRIERRARRHLAFGHGVHYCIGAHLARLETRVVLEELLARVPAWSVVDDEVTYAVSASVRGPQFLNLSLSTH